MSWKQHDRARVYLVTRLVDSTYEHLSNFEDKLHKIENELASFPNALKEMFKPNQAISIGADPHTGLHLHLLTPFTRLASAVLLLGQHWAVLVENHYYHLKKTKDDALALDLTPFREDEEVFRMPVWETKLTPQERKGIALCVVAAMSNTTGLDTIPIKVKDDGYSSRDKTFDVKEYRKWLASSAPNCGQYDVLRNNCHHFAIAFLCQLFVPTVSEVITFCKVFVHMRDEWKRGFADIKKRKHEILQRAKNHHTIESAFAPSDRTG